MSKKKHKQKHNTRRGLAIRFLFRQLLNNKVLNIFLLEE